MTRWFFLFLLALTLVISFRLLTFSPFPNLSKNCDKTSIESNMSGVWNLNRMDNFSGIEPYLIAKDLNSYSFFIYYLVPSFLSNSQILSIDFCGDEVTVTYNVLRNWRQYKFSIIQNQAFKSNFSDLSGTASFQPETISIEINAKDIDFTEELYLDGGELIRETEFSNSKTGKIKYFYRKND